MNYETRRRRVADVKKRAAQTETMFSQCRVMDCRKPTRAATSDGMDIKLCRSHHEFHQRHGSPYKGSYPASVLNPYRKAALIWIKANEDDRWVKQAVMSVAGLYQRAGQHVEAFRLRGLSPKDRARAHWARLRKAEVDPRLPVAAWLAVEMAIADDPQPVSANEFKQVQAAKLVHKLASGTHKRWEQERRDGSIHVEEKHWYPRSRGRVLRYIGEDLEKAVELLVDQRLEDIKSAYH
jgi:hypothetical protein